MFKDYLSKYKEKILKSLYKPYETERVFQPPFYFALLILFYFKKNLHELNIDILAEQRFQFKGLKRWLIERIINHDYTMPLPKIIYVKLYYGGYKLDEEGNKVLKGKRLKSKYLIEFYETLKSLIDANLNESIIIDRLLAEPNIPIIMRKELKIIQNKIENTSITFYSAVAECEEVFGKFESSIIEKMVLSGKIVEALEDIIERLVDLEDYERTLNANLKTMKVDILLSIGVSYISMAYTVPSMASIINLEKSPDYIRAYVNYCIFMSEPQGILLHVFIILIILSLYKYFSETSVVGFLILKIPTLGQIFIHTEAYKFMTMLTYQYKYIISNEVSKFYASCETVTNEFIKLFFRDKIKDVDENSRQGTYFFERNNFFPVEVRYKMLLGEQNASIPSKLNDLKTWYKKENKIHLSELPRILSDFSLYFSMGLTLISNMGLILFEYYMMTMAPI